MIMRILITPDGKSLNVSSEQEDKETNSDIYSRAALHAPSQWEQNQYRLIMTVLGTFKLDEDKPNDLAMASYRRTKSDENASGYRSVYIGNDTADKIVDFAKQGLTCSCKHILQPQMP